MGQPRDIPSLAEAGGVGHMAFIGSDGTPFAENLQPFSRSGPLRRGIGVSEPDLGFAKGWMPLTETRAAGLPGRAVVFGGGNRLPTRRRRRFFRREKVG